MEGFNVAIIAALVAFIVGNVSGYFLHDYMTKTLLMSENSSKNLLLLAVTTIWVISMLVSIVNPAYQVPIPVHAIMGTVVGFFLYRPKEKEGEK